MELVVDENITLHLTHEKFTHQLFKLIDSNRQHLAAFLPWVSRMKTIEDSRAYLAGSAALCKQKTEVSFIILQNNILVGRIGLHYINNQNKKAEIGYWLGKEATGKGIITKSCIMLINYAFDVLGLKKIEIKAAIKNMRSQAIPQKLHFKQEGILRRAEFVNNEFIDLYLYAILQEEWINTKKNFL